MLPFISRKKLLKEIDKIHDDILFNIESWRRSNNPNKDRYIAGLNSERTALYQIDFYLRHNKHWKTLRTRKELNDICPHGDNYDDCPDCRH